VLRALGLPLSRVAAHLEVSRPFYDFIKEKLSVTADIAAGLGRLARKLPPSSGSTFRASMAREMRNA